MKDLEISATRRGDKISWKAAQRKELSTVKTRKEFYVIHELFKGTLVVFQSNQNWWVMHQFLDIGKGTYFTEDFHGTSSLFWVMDWFQEERRKIKPGQAVFQTPADPFGNDPEEEEPHDDYTVPQKTSYVTRWKPDHDAVHWIRLSKAQDKGLEFWQTKSFASMTWRLYWSCDLSKRRSSKFQKAWNSKTGTQG